MSTARVPTLTNKVCELSSQFKGSRMRSADTEGANDGDAGTFEPGRQWKVKRVKVGEAFACELAQHPGILRFLFNYGPNNKIVGPASTRVVKVPIREKFKQCRVRLSWGMANELELTNARIGNIVLYADGAECRMDFNLQGIVPITKLTMELEAHEGEVRITVRFGAVEERDAEEAERQGDFVDAQNEEEGEEEPEGEGDGQDDQPEEEEERPPTLMRPGPNMPSDRIN